MKMVAYMQNGAHSYVIYIFWPIMFIDFQSFTSLGTEMITDKLVCLEDMEVLQENMVIKRFTPLIVQPQHKTEG